MSDDPFDVAAELANALANARYIAGCDVYAPEWYRRRHPILHLGDCGALDAIRSGDTQKMREALSALKERVT